MDKFNKVRFPHFFVVISLTGHPIPDRLAGISWFHQLLKYFLNNISKGELKTL
jgi:hypothetical protein